MTNAEPPTEPTTPDPAAVAPGAAEDDAPAARRPTARGALIVGARTTSGLIAAAAAAAVVLAAATIPVPTWSVSPATVVVTPEAASARLVCSGAPLRLADDSGADAASAFPLATPTTTVVGDSVTTSALAQSDAGTGGTDDAPVVLELRPTTGGVTPAAGAQETIVGGDTAGLVTQTCAAPASRQWLVAGATTTGRSALLTITNPTTVAAEVDLVVLDESGPVDAAGLTGIVVPAGAQRVIPLSGFVLEAESLAVLVTSSGGNVVATLQSAATRTLRSGGIDVAVPVSGAAQTLTIPGVHIADGTALDAAVQSDAGFADAVTAVRIAAPPGGGDAEVEVVLVPVGMTVDEARAAAAANPFVEGGEGAATADVDLSVATPRAITVTVPDGRVVDVPVPKLGTGEYTAVVTATVPVVGAARVTAVAGSVVDLAWVASAASLGATAAIAVPETAAGTASSSKLVIANPTAAAITPEVTVVGATSQPAAAEIPAGGSTIVTVPAGAEVRIDGGTGLVASIVTGTGGLLAVSPVQPSVAAARSVTVVP